MTPKEKYEERRRKEKMRQEQLEYERSENEIRNAESFIMFDRAVTALEEISVSLSIISEGK